MEETIELLDRQVAFLLHQQEDAAFLVQIDSFLRALDADARLSAYVQDALKELEEISSVMAGEDARLVLELVELRNELVAILPDADDSSALPPRTEEGPSRTVAHAEYEGTLAYFDTFASSQPADFNADAAGGVAGTLLKILQNKYRLHTRPRNSSRTVELTLEGDELPQAETTTEPAAAPAASTVELKASTTGRCDSATLIGSTTTQLDGCGCEPALLADWPYSDSRRLVMR